MKATYNKNAKTKFTSFHRKETKCYFDSFTALVPALDYEGNPTMDAVAELRLYGTGNTNTACLWINDRKSGIYTNGSGSAGGYGYHRPSAAASEAIRNAGIELEQNISRVGNEAIERAMRAIAEMLGHTQIFVYHSHQ